MAGWLKETGPQSDIVISSRVRIARNIEGIPFPHGLSEALAKEVTEKVHKGILAGNTSFNEDFQLISMRETDEVDRLNYVEKHLISPDLAKNIATGNMLVNQEETISIMINEEDHIRIQCLLPGLQLQEGWDIADKIDDLLEEKVTYAFDEELGYLTACPTNLGTGIRSSVMLHLPALSLTGFIQAVLRAAGQIGLAVRGIYGEGTEFIGNLYQISNQVTLGITEKEIIGNLHDVTMQIVEKERGARKNLVDAKKIELEDRVFRSFGILKNARKIAANEAMQLISDVKLGVNLGLIQEAPLEKVNSLITMIQPGYLQKYYERPLNIAERDIKRAELIRSIL
ncbi:protein arginine kinase [Natronincola peptidivorans]|uniref:Protein-arginine kinase n=1 Tax=Natronincola peptidivorans TaxID=426128 RepID=A0A1I0GPH1_9FIRM|nr:protein arginine kinase [Natronincola peptidivorans]SET72871.1 protein arginine kinase [Natronincola peptidivorans]